MATVKRMGGDVNLKGLEEAIKGLEGKVGKAGWFASSKYESGVPVAYVASIHEFGVASRSIPPRPFMRPTIAAKAKAWANQAKEGAKAVLHGKIGAEVVMELIAKEAVGDVKKTIASIWSPALSPKTIQARMRKRADKKTKGNLTKPLIDTGLMFDTMEAIVEDE